MTAILLIGIFIGTAIGWAARTLIPSVSDNDDDN